MTVLPKTGNQWNTTGGSFGFLNSSWLSTLRTTARTQKEKRPAAIATPRDLVDNCSLNGTTTAESRPMLKRQATAFVTVRKDKESEMDTTEYEGRRNLED